MPRSIRVIKIDPVKKTYVAMMLEGGNSLVRPVQRTIRAKQLGWREVCTILETRLMGVRAKESGIGTETYDAGPTPLIVTCDAQAEEGQAGWRMRGGPAVAGMALLFGKGLGGGMIDCPVGTDWLDRHLVWLTPEETDADEGENGDERTPGVVIDAGDQL